MAADDVSLPDLEVIAQFSLAVRAATAPRAQVVAALQADLRALTGSAAPSGPDGPRRRAVPRPGTAARPQPDEEAPAPRGARRAPAGAATPKAAPKAAARRRAAAPEA